MSKPPPARYRTTNWSSYSAALRKRGSIMIWTDREMAWLAPHEGPPGRPPVFSDAAIQFCLSVKVLFKLVASMRHRFEHDVDATDRRYGGQPAPAGGTGLVRPRLQHPVPQAKDLGGSDPVSSLRWPAQPARALSGHRCAMPCRVADSTGITFLGDGEWQARKHGAQGRRQSLPGRRMHAFAERGVRCFSPWTLRPRTSGLSSSLRAAMATALSCPSYSARFPRMRR